MHKKTRRLLFYFSVLFFLVLSFAAVVYALGYKYDFVKNQFLKTGSFAIRANTNADVYINDNLAGTTSFLSNSFSKSRLLPRTYNLRVQKENYQPWEKLVAVEEGNFKEFPSVVLVPSKLEEVLVASSSLGNIVSKSFDTNKKLAVFANKQQTETIRLNDGSKELSKTTLMAAINTSIESKETPASVIADADTMGTVSPDKNKTAWFKERELWVKWLKDSGHQPYRPAGHTELLTRFSQTISDVQWYKGSQHLIANVGGILKFIEIDGRGGLNIFDITAAGELFYHDSSSNNIYKIEGNRVVRVRLE